MATKVDHASGFFGPAHRYHVDNVEWVRRQGRPRSKLHVRKRPRDVPRGPTELSRNGYPLADDAETVDVCRWRTRSLLHPPPEVSEDSRSAQLRAQINKVPCSSAAVMQHRRLSGDCQLVASTGNDMHDNILQVQNKGSQDSILSPERDCATSSP